MKDILPPKPEGRDPNASFTLTPEAIDAFKRGSPIEAIKIIREATGVGLAEAKSIVEEIAKQIPASPYARPGLAPGEVPRGTGAGKWLALVAVGLLAVLAALYY